MSVSSPRIVQSKRLHPRSGQTAEDRDRSGKRHLARALRRMCLSAQSVPGHVHVLSEVGRLKLSHGGENRWLWIYRFVRRCDTRLTHRREKPLRDPSVTQVWPICVRMVVVYLFVSIAAASGNLPSLCSYRRDARFPANRCHTPTTGNGSLASTPGRRPGRVLSCCAYQRISGQRESLQEQDHEGA